MKEEEYKKIHKLLRDGRFSDLYNFLVSIPTHDNPHYCYWMGVVLNKLDRQEEAIEALTKSLLLPNDSKTFRAGTHFQLGMIYGERGDNKNFAEHIKNVVENFTDEVPPFEEKIDMVNSLALTYKKLKDTDNAFKYYNLALEILVQGVYNWIKATPVHEMGSGISNLKPTSTAWLDLALQIAVKNAAKEDVGNARVPTPETAMKLFEQNPLVGRAFFDMGKVRYILPAYFEAFKNALRRNNLYSTITNNVGMLYADTADIRKAGDTFMEAIDFIPSGSTYNAPVLNFEELKKEYGNREYWK